MRTPIGAVLADLRTRIATGEFKRPYKPRDLSAGGFAYWPSPKAYDLPDDRKWAERYDHPKD